MKQADIVVDQEGIRIGAFVWISHETMIARGAITRKAYQDWPSALPFKNGKVKFTQGKSK